MSSSRPLPELPKALLNDQDSLLSPPDSTSKHFPKRKTSLRPTSDEFIPPKSNDDHIGQELNELKEYAELLSKVEAVKLDDEFQQEFESIEKWYTLLSEYEQMMVVYGFLRNSSPVQLRFFQTVLQQMVNKDPVHRILDPVKKERRQHVSSLQESISRRTEDDAHIQKMIDEDDALFNDWGVKNEKSSLFDDSFLKWNNEAKPNRPGGLAKSWGPVRIPSPLVSDNISLLWNESREYRAMNPKPARPTSGHQPKPSPFMDLEHSFPNGMDSLNQSHQGRESYLSIASQIQRSSSTPPVLNRINFKPPGFDATSWQEKPVLQRHDRYAPRLAANREKGKIPDQIDFRLIKGNSAFILDTSAWLKSLRLHKYTPCFQEMTWKQMVEMSDEDLEKKGVGALGARRKMLKVFEQVREEAAQKNL